MNRVLVPCRVGARGADLSTKVTADEARALRAAGFDFLVRYLSLTTPSNGDLGPAEIDFILGAGLGLMAVQRVRLPGWTPGAPIGSQDGGAAARQAVILGLPRGSTLWADLEGTSTTSTGAELAAYVAGWAAAVRAGGYDPGAYVGAGLPPEVDELALWKLPVDRYWRSQSAVPNVGSRGFQLLQLYPQIKVGELFPSAPSFVADVVVDVDIAQSDYLGSVPSMTVQIV